MKINPLLIYNRCYALLNNVTPCLSDCGARCGAVCCKDSEAGTGMYLYPGEENMYKALPDWASIEPSGFFSLGKEVPILSCPGKCDRDLRPLACRIFPLIPYKKSGENMKIIFDPRAAAMCPLRPEDLTDMFCEAVTRAMNIVVKTKEGRAFIEDQSTLIDEYVRLYL